MQRLVIGLTTSLVYQMNGDFEDYSENQHSYSTHLIMAVKTKLGNFFTAAWPTTRCKEVVLQFDVVIGDETCIFKDLSLQHSYKDGTCYRFGFTGHLMAHRHTDLFLVCGLIMKVITQELMDSDTVFESEDKGLVEVL